MRQLNIAIIGQGRSGRDIHGAFFNSDANGGRFKVVAAADEIAERRQRAEVEYGSGCTVYSDWRSILDRRDIDLVINSTFSYEHYPVTLELLEHGFNAVCEKPAAMRSEEVRRLIAKAAEKGVMYNVFQQSRFTPYFDQVKKVIASGVLGRIIEIDISFDGFSRRWDWQTLQCMGGGSLYNTGPHPLDQALNLLDMYDVMPGEGLNVFCRMDRVNTWGDAEDYVKLILTAKDKPLIDLMISSCNPYPCFTYRIQGQYGGLKGSMSEMEWKWYDPAEAPAQKLIREPLATDEGMPKYCGETLKWHSDSWSGSGSAAFNSAVDRYYTMIYEHLVNGAPLEIHAGQVVQQIAVIEEAHRQNPLSVDFVLPDAED